MTEERKEVIDGVTYWRKDLSNIGNCSIGEGTIVHSHVWIGDRVKVGKNCRIEAFSFIPPGVVIRDNVFIGPRVTFTNDKYPPSKNWVETIICDGVSIGAGAVILPGITINTGAKIAAGAVVTKDVRENAVMIGIPAKERID